MKWTEEELQYLREHYPDDNTVEIAKHLGRTDSAVHQMAAKQGLRKSAEFMEKTLYALGRQRMEVHFALQRRKGGRGITKALLTAAGIRTRITRITRIYKEL